MIRGAHSFGYDSRFNVGCHAPYVPPMYEDPQQVLDYCVTGQPLSTQVQEFVANATNGRPGVYSPNLTTFAWVHKPQESVATAPASTKIPEAIKTNAKEEASSSWTFADFLPSDFFDFLPLYKDDLQDSSCKKSKKCKELLDTMKDFGLPVPDQCCPAKNWPVPTVKVTKRPRAAGVETGGYRVDGSDTWVESTVGREVDDTEKALKIHTEFFILTVFLLALLVVVCWYVSSRTWDTHRGREVMYKIVVFWTTEW